MFKERLELIRLDYEVKRVRVIFLKDYAGLPTPSGTLDVKRGDEIELPRWQARLLKGLGFVEVKESPIDVDYINTVHFRERRRVGDQINPIPQDFYLRSSEFIEKLDRLIREAPSGTLLRDREVAEKNLLDIGETRLSKILRLAYSLAENVRDKMSPEEAIVYNHMVKAVEAWREYLKTLTSKGGGRG